MSGMGPFQFTTDNEVTMDLAPLLHALAVMEENKHLGNTCFKRGLYAEAIRLYSKPLAEFSELFRKEEMWMDVKQLSELLDTKAILHNNRAACYLKLGQHVEVRLSSTCALTASCFASICSQTCM